MSEQDKPQPADKAGEAELDNQLDALLSTINEAELDASPADTTANITSSDDSAKSDAAEINPPGADPPPAEDILGDDLANQIQELLDSTAESMGENTQLAATTDESPAAAQPIDTGAAAQDRSEIKALDATLAADADDAIAGDFETTEDVVAAANLEAAPTSSEVAAPHAPEAMSVDNEPSLEGDFESPADLVAKAESKSGASAADVARELDSQPEKTARAVGLKKPRLPIAVSPRVFKSAVILVNRPFANASAQTRNLIGWVGLLTLFNAGILIAGSLIMHATRSKDDASAKPVPTATTSAGPTNDQVKQN